MMMWTWTVMFLLAFVAVPASADEGDGTDDEEGTDHGPQPCDNYGVKHETRVGPDYQCGYIVFVCFDAIELGAGAGASAKSARAAGATATAGNCVHHGDGCPAHDDLLGRGGKQTSGIVSWSGGHQGNCTRLLPIVAGPS